MSSLSSATSSNVGPSKPCNICGGESCIMIPSITQQHLCLLHYYTTGAHRSNPIQKQQRLSMTGISSKKKSASLFVESQKMEKQLPNVQEIFAEAFIDLQKEIGEESARAFQAASTADDPLAALLDPGAAASSYQPAISRSFRKQKSNSNNKKKKSTSSKNDHLEGGFIRETKLPEKYRKLQNPQSFTSIYGNDSPSMSKKQRVAATMSHTTIGAAAATKPNPYQRKHTPSKNVWNQILDNNADIMSNNNNMIGNEKKASKKKMRFEDIEKEMISNITAGSTASSKTCTCGSTNVTIEGNVSNRSNGIKGAIWGSKDRAETFERCHCQTCGRTWNEE